MRSFSIASNVLSDIREYHGSRVILFFIKRVYEKEEARTILTFIPLRDANPSLLSKDHGLWGGMDGMIVYISLNEPSVYEKSIPILALSPSLLLHTSEDEIFRLKTIPLQDIIGDLVFIVFTTNSIDFSNCSFSLSDGSPVSLFASFADLLSSSSTDEKDILDDFLPSNLRSTRKVSKDLSDSIKQRIHERSLEIFVETNSGTIKLRNIVLCNSNSCLNSILGTLNVMPNAEKCIYSHSLPYFLSSPTLPQVYYNSPDVTCLYPPEWAVNLLLNPHSGLRPEKNSYAITGDIVFYHYSFDKGWGCAYRSLQAILSWYCLQGLVAVPPPTIKSIQSKLFEINDYSSNFIGSKEWISAVDVGLYLGAIGIDARIETFKTGKEFRRQVESFIRHFKYIKTPVMVGGNKKAYTILGVSFSPPSNCKYLILDPHYSGSALDKEKVIKGGWCSWISPEKVFSSNVLYSICFPGLIIDKAP